LLPIKYDSNASAAEAIGMAARNLVSVGREAMTNGDDALKSQMPSACEQVGRITATHMLAHTTSYRFRLLGSFFSTPPFALRATLSLSRYGVGYMKICAACMDFYLFQLCANINLLRLFLYYVVHSC
jgi:hypothetical protein